MANSNPPEHTRFKKGVCYNPSGRPKLSPELRKIKEFTTDEIRRTIAKYMRLSKGELQRIIKEESDKLPMFEAMVCSILANAYKTGDFSKLDFLLNRSGHKQKDEKVLDVHSYTEKEKNEVVAKIPRESAIALLREHSSWARRAKEANTQHMSTGQEGHTVCGVPLSING